MLFSSNTCARPIARKDQEIRGQPGKGNDLGSEYLNRIDSTNLFHDGMKHFVGLWRQLSPLSVLPHVKASLYTAIRYKLKWEFNTISAYLGLEFFSRQQVHSELL